MTRTTTQDTRHKTQDTRHITHLRLAAERRDKDGLAVAAERVAQHRRHRAIPVRHVRRAAAAAPRRAAAAAGSPLQLLLPLERNDHDLCDVLYCVVLCCCVALRCVALHCVALCCVVLCCVVCVHVCVTAAIVVVRRRRRHRTSAPQRACATDDAGAQ